MKRRHFTLAGLVAMLASPFARGSGTLAEGQFMKLDTELNPPMIYALYSVPIRGHVAGGDRWIASILARGHKTTSAAFLVEELFDPAVARWVTIAGMDIGPARQTIIGDRTALWRVLTQGETK